MGDSAILGPFGLPNSCSDLRFDEASSTKEEAKEALTLDQWLRQMVGDQKTIENPYVSSKSTGGS
jgi:hypothetical protein